MPRPRLLYCITRAEHGGAQSHVRDLIAGFNSRFEIHLAVGDEHFLTEQARVLGAEVHVIPDIVQPVSPAKDYSAIRQITALIKTVKPDLVHCHSSKAGVLGRIAARVAGVPSIYTSHGWAFAEPYLVRKIVSLPSEWLAGQLGTHIINSSLYDQTLALKYRIAPAHKLSVVHNGIADSPKRVGSVTNSTPRLVMVARFAPPKDHQILLRAIAGVAGTYDLILVGVGPLQAQLQEQARSLGVENRVRFLGFVEDLEGLLAESDIFILTSDKEGFPLSILEAMRAGLPVVASDVGGVKEAVIDGETGFLIPRGDVSTLRQRLEQLITDPVLRARMGAAGRRRYETHFTLDQMLAKTLAVYEKVLGTNPGRKLV